MEVYKIIFKILFLSSIIITYISPVLTGYSKILAGLNSNTYLKNIKIKKESAYNYSVTRISINIKIDGKLSEREWKFSRSIFNLVQ